MDENLNQISNLSEEIFCLKFELQALADVLLRNESERWVPGYLKRNTEKSHIDRYHLACQMSSGLEVLDVACGTGKGAHLLVTTGLAKRVEGLDLDKDAIRYASWRFQHPQLSFNVANAEALTFHKKFDLAVSFETIEHVEAYSDFLKGIKKSLKPGGYFLVSTPISKLPQDAHPNNPYHKREWGFERFQEVISEYFTVEKIWVQLYPVYPVPNFWMRILNKLKAIFGINPAAELPNFESINFSSLEEFKGQYHSSELGGLREGYQIILGKVKS